MASVVWSGFRQVQTFIFSTLSTVSRSVKIRPPLSSACRPLGNASSITRYSHSSALTNGATYVFFAVMTGSNPAIPSFFNISSTDASGLGVILSIIVHGKATLSFDWTYSQKPSSTRCCCVHCLAKAYTASRSLSPLCEQLSILTKAIGFFPD